MRISLIASDLTPGGPGGFRLPERLWDADTSPDGSFVLEDLRQEGVGARLTGESADRRWRVAPVDLPADVRTMNLTLEAQPGVTVTVLDPEGRGLAGARVALGELSRSRQQNSPASRAWILEAMRGGYGATRQYEADAAGRCFLPFEDLETCALLVQPPLSRASEMLEASDASWGPRDSVVSLDPSLSLRGTVLDQAGAPVEGGHVEVRPKVGAQTPEAADVDREGRFALTRLRPGREEVRFVHTEYLVTHDAPWMAVEAGQADVVLNVDLGTELAVRIVGWPEGESCVAFLTREGSAGAPEARVMSTVAGDGSVRFRGLSPADVYDVWIPPKSEALLRRGARGLVGSSAYRAGLRAGGPVRSIPLEEGRTVIGRVVCPEGVAKPPAFPGDWSVVGHAEIRGRCLLDGADVVDEGRFWFHGVPPGRWTISVTIPPPAGKTISWVGTAELGEDAEDVEMDVRPSPLPATAGGKGKP